MGRYMMIKEDMDIPLLETGAGQTGNAFYVG